MSRSDRPVDALDCALIDLLAEEPRIGVLEASRRLAVARGTVQARLDRLEQRGVVTGFGPDVNLAALGYTVHAYTTIEIQQGKGGAVVAHLEQIPEVLEAHTITGPGDLLVRIAARSNDDLQRVLDKLVATDGIQRAASVLALATRIPPRVRQLVHVVAGLPAEVGPE